MKYSNVTTESECLLTLKCPKGHLSHCSETELETSFSKCDLCGNHGDVEITWKCDDCNKGYIYTLKSW